MVSSDMRSLMLIVCFASSYFSDSKGGKKEAKNPLFEKRTRSFGIGAFALLRLCLFA